MPCHKTTHGCDEGGHLLLQQPFTWGNSYSAPQRLQTGRGEEIKHIAILPIFLPRFAMQYLSTTHFCPWLVRWLLSAMSADTDRVSIFSKRQVPLNGRTFRDFDSVSFDSLKIHPMQLAKVLNSLQNSKRGISLRENHLEATFPCSQAIEIPNSFFSKNLPHYLSTPRPRPYLSDGWGPCWCSHSQPDSPWPRTTSTDALARNSAPWLYCTSLHGDGTTSCDLASHSSILLYLLSSLIQVLSLPLQMAAPC